MLNHKTALSIFEMASSEFLPVKNALTLKADKKLIGERVNIRVGNVYVYRYPGAFGKEHEIIFEFEAKHNPNNSQSSSENLAFTQVYVVNNGGGSGTTGLMAVKGLTVPKNGIDFLLNTVYSGNRRAKRLLNFMNSSVFNSGLELIDNVNPVVEKVAGYAKGIVEFIAEGNKGRVVQKIGIGFDFSNNPEVASLKLGTYVAIQAHRTDINFDEIAYDTKRSIFVVKSTKERLPFNHLTFVVSKYSKED